MAVHKGKYQLNEKGVARGRISTRATLANLAAVIGRGMAMVAAGVFFITAFPALAYHPSHGGETSSGSASYDAILPIIIAGFIVMAGVVFWGRKTPKKKSKARGKIQSKPQMKRKRVKHKKRRR